MKENSEKRLNQRAPMSAPIFFSLDGAKWLKGSSSDISYMGMYIRTRKTVKPGTDIDLKFHLPKFSKDAPIIAKAKAIRIHSDQGRQVGLGVQFVSLRAGDWQAIRIYHDRTVKPQSKFDLLLRENVIGREVLDQAMEIARKETDPVKSDVASVLLNEFDVPKDRLGASLAEYYQTEFIKFTETIIIPGELIRGLNEKYLKNNFWVPLGKEDDTVIILADDPFNQRLVTEISRLGDLAESYKLWVGLREDILKFIDLATGKHKPDEELTAIVDDLHDRGSILEDVRDEEDLLSENAPAVVRMVNKIIQDAFERGASDVHIEPLPRRNSATIRLRQDGVCVKYMDLPRHAKALINRVKILSSLKLDERRVAQSGKIKMKYGRREVELRVEVTPTVGGNEDVVMRILNSTDPMPIEQMGLSESNHKKIEGMITKPHGIILVVGPTGSGKTTALHSLLQYLNTPEKKIWTAEDPVEITQKGLRQVQINPRIRPNPWDFAAAMRSFLRADPDIIMVGEMRDAETSKIAIEASLTGHLVLSTLHTNSAPETIARLIEMGMNHVNLADALLGIMAQRLVRTLCPTCKKEYKPSPEEIESIRGEYGDDWADDLNPDPKKLTLYKSKGCIKCNNIGYRGRMGLHEVLIGTRSVKELVRKRGSVEEIRSQALNDGTKTLKMDGIQKVFQGHTDMTQVLKVCID